MPAEVHTPDSLEYEGLPLECRELNFENGMSVVHVHSEDGGLRNATNATRRLWGDTNLTVDGRSVSGSVLGTTSDPFSIAAASRIFGIFGKASLSLGNRSSIVWADDDRPVEIPKGALSGCTVTFTPRP